MSAYIVKFYFSWYTRKNPIPGPIPLPLIGNLYQIGKDVGKEAIKLQKKYGDIFEVTLGQKTAVFVCRADLAEKINSPTLKNNAFAHRTAPNPGLDELGLSKSGVAFNRDLDAWKFNRRILSQTVMSPKFLRENVDLTNQIFDELEKYLIQFEPETKINIARWSSYFTTDTVLTAATGEKSYAIAAYNNSLSTSIKTEISESVNKSLKFVESIDMFSSSFMFFFNIPPIIRHHFPIVKSLYKKYKNNNEWLDAELEKIVSKRKQEIENNPDKPLEHNVLNLLFITNSERDTNKISDMRTMIDTEIVGTLKDIFIAGTDTTRNTICIVLYYILKYPSVKDKLIKEYELVYGDLSKKPNITYESIDKLVYTEAVIIEATRIEPTTPVFMRSASSDTEISGYKIKKDTIIFTSYIGIHTHEAHWDEPKKFNPDRFLKENSHNIVENSYLTFGGGVRLCPGKNWAMKNIIVFIVRLLTKFEVSLVNPDSLLSLEYNTVQHCKELEIYIKERKTNV